MRIAQSVAPTTTAVTVSQARQWCNMQAGVDADDAVLRQIIDEVVAYVEARTNRYLLTQTLTIDFDDGEVGSVIRLPVAPVASVSSVATYDEDGDSTTESTSAYSVQTGDDPRIALNSGYTWTSTRRDWAAMRVTCVVGYGGDVVPSVGYEPASSAASGLDDLSASGTYTGSTRAMFEVVIDGADADPETFKWRKITWDGNGVPSYGAWTEGVAITGAAQLLSDGISVTIQATTGHTADDTWNVEVYEVLPAHLRMLLRGLIIHQYQSKGGGVNQTVSGQLISIPQQFERMIAALRVVPVS